MSNRHQPEHAKPQPGLEPGRRDQVAATQVVVAEVKRRNEDTRKVLDILRKTRSKRDVGGLEIPKHLQRPEPEPPAPARMILNPRTGKPFA